MSMCLTQTQTLPKNIKKLLEALREREREKLLLASIDVALFIVLRLDSEN